MRTGSDITRRDFIKTAGLVAAAATFGCATAETPKPESVASVTVPREPVIYPILPGNKVQAPEAGCMVGFRKVYSALGGAEQQLVLERQRAQAAAKDLDELLGIAEPWERANSKHWVNNLHQIIQQYNKELGKKPAILVMYELSKLFKSFRTEEASALTKQGVIPYISINPNLLSRPNLSAKLDEILAGKIDQRIADQAKQATEVGKQYGGFFLTTMEESNGNWYYWGQSQNFIPAWRHIWKIFEDQGANQYATWVWECYCPEAVGRRIIGDPDTTYPGDKYVDWIGLSGFARSKYPDTYMSFGALVGKTYNAMRRNHPSKPIMQAEFGASNDGGQARWVKDAYKEIRSMPGIKAAIFWDNITTTEGDDHTLNEKSLQTMKEIFKDPYWIMAQ